MQCTNCQFNNMPGSAVCGRCGTSLGLATAAVDVHPPRAGKFAKRMRRVRPVARTYYEAREVAGEARSRTLWLFGQVAPSAPPLPVVWRMILPGWSHLYAGRRLAGHLFLWSFLVCLLFGLLLFGHLWGSIFLGLAFSIHSSAILDLISQDLAPGEVVRRMVRGLLITVALALILYLPMGRLLTRVADPQVIDMAVAPFLEEHDVLLVNHWAHARVGRIVLYDLPEYTAPGTGHNRTVFTGRRIDRILAGPGDSVLWEDGRLTVNGVPTDLMPANPIHPPGKALFLVPQGHYFILPSTTMYARGPANSGIWRALCMIPFESIHGQAYLRSHPISRWAVIR
jgi:hypothetical protein